MKCHMSAVQCRRVARTAPSFLILVPFFQLDTPRCTGRARAKSLACDHLIFLHGCTLLHAETSS